MNNKDIFLKILEDNVIKLCSGIEYLNKFSNESLYNRDNDGSVYYRILLNKFINVFNFKNGKTKIRRLNYSNSIIIGFDYLVLSTVWCLIELRKTHSNAFKEHEIKYINNFIERVLDLIYEEIKPSKYSNLHRVITSLKNNKIQLRNNEDVLSLLVTSNDMIVIESYKTYSNLKSLLYKVLNIVDDYDNIFYDNNNDGKIPLYNRLLKLICYDDILEDTVKYHFKDILDGGI